VTRALAEIIERRGAPVAIRSDNGPEVSSRHFLAWCIERRIDALRIAKHARGELPRPVSGRMSERKLVLEWVGHAEEDRGLA
jgi:putative transposase